MWRQRRHNNVEGGLRRMAKTAGREDVAAATIQQQGRAAARTRRRRRGRRERRGWAAATSGDEDGQESGAASTRINVTPPHGPENAQRVKARAMSDATWRRRSGRLDGLQEVHAPSCAVLARMRGAHLPQARVASRWLLPDLAIATPPDPCNSASALSELCTGPIAGSMRCRRKNGSAT